ncbi:MAG: hypothetical protein ICV60_03035 [Pyrinomonadaceae bacterium]|nr:hypothetical protein [Pyrinomonadaceae bacterium]
MSRKLKALKALFASVVMVVAASAAMGQLDKIKPVGVKPTLGCCKCLGGTNTLDLSTVSSNNWTVNGSPAIFLTAIHPLWNINPGPAKWISSAATGGTGTMPAGPYEYRLEFVVPACSIEQKVTLSGNYGGDDDVQVFLDNALISQCVGGWCFNTPKKTLPTFSTAVGSGSHVLRVRVVNGSPSPSGMFVNAKLSGTCTSQPTK